MEYLKQVELSVLLLAGLDIDRRPDCSFVRHVRRITISALFIS